MLLHDVGEIIAIREFSLTDGAKVTLTIRKPQAYPDGRDFYCPFQISGIGKDTVWHTGGVDGLQALIIALKTAATFLYTSQEFQTGQLSWIAGSNPGDIGFPAMEPEAG